MVDDERWRKTEARMQEAEALRRHVDTARYDGLTLSQWLRRPENEAGNLPAATRVPYSAEAWASVEIDLKYAGYISRQEVAIRRLANSEERRIPAAFDFTAIGGLRVEARQKLSNIRPETLGQAARISGVTPADLALLSIELERGNARATG
jgi:tRNA uridine 5-carboxymethylaminomethyl modification enzyme